MHELAKTLLPPPRKQNTACDACRSAAFLSFSHHSPSSSNVQLAGLARSNAIESPATIKLVVDFCSRSPCPLHAQPPTQVSGRLPARSLLCDSLVNPRSVHQHCLSKDYPCTSVLASRIPPLNPHTRLLSQEFCPAGDGKKAAPKAQITKRVNNWVNLRPSISEPFPF